MKKENIIRGVLTAELVLLVPLLALLFSVDGWDWDGRDFIFAGFLLAGVGYAYTLIVNGLKNSSRQVVVGVVLAAAILLIWAELAVGVFGSPFAGS